MHVRVFTDDERGTGAGTLLHALRYHAASDIRFRTCPSRTGLAALRVRDVLKEVERDRDDLIHILTTGALAVAALYIARRLRIPIVGSFDTALARGTLIQRQYLRMLCRSCDRLLVPSMLALNRLIGQGLSEARLLLWRPGVDCGMFAPSRRSAELRERWQVDDGRPAVIYAGRLKNDACVAGLLSIEFALRRSHPMHRLIVVGDGPGRDVLQARCSQAMFVGAVPHEAMPELLASADVFIAPGDRDSAAHAVLEAQASGLPCVVMNDSSAGERVSPASALRCGSLVDMIVETAALVRDASRRVAMARAAREHALRQQWAPGLSSLFTGYRSVAQLSDSRGDLRPALVSQSRRL
jgi:glycosyltransferase involved in cell wall biosynthesis